MSTSRQNYVDIAKAFAIIAVVFGHIGFQYPDIKLLPIRTLAANLWHVPVFFMIGGFFIKEERLANPFQFIKGIFPCWWSFHTIVVRQAVQKNFSEYIKIICVIHSNSLPLHRKIN